MVRRASALPVQVAQSLLQRIIAEEFPAGTVLPSERELQDHYGVSRPVVREAIKLLAARGIIATSSGQGAVVASDMTSPARDALVLAFFRAHASAEDILNTRTLLEPEIAAMAATQATPLQIRRINSMTRAFDGELDGSEESQTRLADRWSTTDARFHVLLAEASQNPVLAILAEVIVGILWQQRRSGRNYHPGPERELALSQHRLIAAAVAARDPEAARQAMLEHLQSTREALMQFPDGLQSTIDVMIDGSRM
ncbi:MAG TPA: FadR/GntR family transcriptional regulator [Thermomicrobiales bacterium]|jgi:GntR family transcriptional repressor for pyruvate dehydrogenase complex